MYIDKFPSNTSNDGRASNAQRALRKAAQAEVFRRVT